METSRIAPMTVSLALWLVVVLAFVPGAARPKCETKEVKLVSVGSDVTEFRVSIPTDWEPTVGESPLRITVEDANSRCSLSITVAPSALSLDSLSRLYEGLYYGSDLLSGDCRSRWTSRIVWADKVRLGEYNRRYGSETVQAMYARAGDRIVTARLRCRRLEGESPDWSTALAIFASISPSKKPPLP
jgi:hypothetical protein